MMSIEAHRAWCELAIYLGIGADGEFYVPPEGRFDHSHNSSGEVMHILEFNFETGEMSCFDYDGLQIKTGDDNQGKVGGMRYDPEEDDEEAEKKDDEDEGDCRESELSFPGWEGAPEKYEFD